MQLSLQISAISEFNYLFVFNYLFNFTESMNMEVENSIQITSKMVNGKKFVYFHLFYIRIHLKKCDFPRLRKEVCCHNTNGTCPMRIQPETKKIINRRLWLQVQSDYIRIYFKRNLCVSLSFFFNKTCVFLLLSIFHY